MKSKSMQSVISFLLVIFASLSVTGQEDRVPAGTAKVEEGDYIIGDIYEQKSINISGEAARLMKSKYFRIISLTNEYSIDLGTHDGRTILIVANKDKYMDYAEGVSKSKDPLKYAKLESGAYEAYASFNDASAFCQANGGRIPKDYEIEIGLKYYHLSYGIKYAELSKESRCGLNAYYEFAFNNEGEPILMKYYAGSLDGISNRFIAVTEKLRIQEKDNIAASVRCAY